MPISFVAERDLSSALVTQVEALSPANPFCTAAYLNSMRAGGNLPWVVGLQDHDRLAAGAFAFEQAGRINRTLTIASIPEISEPAGFWDGLLELCQKMKLSHLGVNSYGSVSSAIPSLPGEFRRRKRWEFVVDLRESDLWKKIHDNHRRRIKKALKLGIELQVSVDAADTQHHASVIAASMQRRTERGEYVPTVQETKEFRIFLETGAGKLFQARYDGKVLSSAMVLISNKGGYLQSGGTSPEGMELGASHFLQHEIMKVLQNEKKEIYNLGGTDEPDSGLAMFKVRFGASPVALEAVEALVGTSMRAAVGHLARRMQAHSTTAGQIASRLKSRLSTSRKSPTPAGKVGDA